MIVYDPLYGKISIPNKYDALLYSPEVRRLSQVRLLNTITPSLATLGEIRRYSHVLGVVHLMNQFIKSHNSYTYDEKEALLICAILHDIGTPPFGHLFEYHLKALTGWSHENVIMDIIKGKHVPENISSQIFYGKQLSVNKYFTENNFDISKIEEIIFHKSKLSLLLFGTIDIDNLDNICRMAYYLNITNFTNETLYLVNSMDIDNESNIKIRRSEDIVLIRKWLKLREKIYKLLIYDNDTVSAQSVLSKAICIGFRHNVLTEFDCYLTDEELLLKLLKNENTKKYILNDYLSYLPKVRLIITVVNFGKINKIELESTINRILEQYLNINSFYVYVLNEKGSFSKKICVNINESLEFIGETSQNIIIYASFLKSAKANNKVLRKIYEDICIKLNFEEEQITSYLLDGKEMIDKNEKLFN